MYINYDCLFGFFFGKGGSNYSAIVFKKNSLSFCNCSGYVCEINETKSLSIPSGVYMFSFDGSKISVYRGLSLIYERSLSSQEGKVGFFCDSCQLGMIGVRK